MWFKIVISTGILCVSLAALSYTRQVYEDRTQKQHLVTLCGLQRAYDKAVYPAKYKAKPSAQAEVEETLTWELAFNECMRTLTSPKVAEIDTGGLELSLDRIADAI